MQDVLCMSPWKEGLYCFLEGGIFLCWLNLTIVPSIYWLVLLIGWKGFLGWFPSGIEGFQGDKWSGNRNRLV